MTPHNVYMRLIRYINANVIQNIWSCICVRMRMHKQRACARACAPELKGARGWRSRARCEKLGVGALAAAASRVAFDAPALVNWRKRSARSAAAELAGEMRLSGRCPYQKFGFFVTKRGVAFRVGKLPCFWCRILNTNVRLCIK